MLSRSSRRCSWLQRAHRHQRSIASARPIPSGSGGRTSSTATSRPCDPAENTTSAPLRSAFREHEKGLAADKVSECPDRVQHGIERAFHRYHVHGTGRGALEHALEQATGPSCSPSHDVIRHGLDREYQADERRHDHSGFGVVGQAGDRAMGASLAKCCVRCVLGEEEGWRLLSTKLSREPSQASPRLRML